MAGKSKPKSGSETKSAPKGGKGKGKGGKGC